MTNSKAPVRSLRGISTLSLISVTEPHELPPRWLAALPLALEVAVKPRIPHHTPPQPTRFDAPAGRVVTRPPSELRSDELLANAKRLRTESSQSDDEGRRTSGPASSRKSSIFRTSFARCTRSRRPRAGALSCAIRAPWWLVGIAQPVYRSACPTRWRAREACARDDGRGVSDWRNRLGRNVVRCGGGSGAGAVFM